MMMWVHVCVCGGGWLGGGGGTVAAHLNQQFKRQSLQLPLGTPEVRTDES